MLGLPFTEELLWMYFFAILQSSSFFHKTLFRTYCPCIDFGSCPLFLISLVLHLRTVLSAFPTILATNFAACVACSEKYFEKIRQRNTASHRKPSEKHSLSSELSSELESLTVVEVLSAAVVLEYGLVELADVVARDGKQDSESNGVVVINGPKLLGIGTELEAGVKAGVEAGGEVGVGVGVEIVGADSLSSLLLLAEAEPA